MAKTSSNMLTVARRSDHADPTLPVILEFQWPSTALINAPIPRTARGISWVVTSMVLALLAAFAFIPIDQVITARGIVVSQSPTILVQPLDTAIVRSIDVREGQRVKAGQVLARLDPTFAVADLGALAKQVSSYGAEVERLKAEASGQTYEGDLNNPDVAKQVAYFASRNAEFRLKIENFNHRIDELSSVIARAQSDAAGYRERLSVAQHIESLRKELEAKEVGTKLNTLAAADARTEMSRALANAEQTAEGAKRDLKALTAERDGYKETWAADVSQKLIDAQRKLSDAGELQTKAQLRRDLIQLRADRDAIVQSVAKVSVGSVMQSGQPFVTLIPVDAPLEVEANIAGSDNGFVHLGDPVSVKFDTFPFAQYGMAEGTVRIVSPNSFTSQDEVRNPTSALPISPANTEPFYRARIAIDRVALRNVPDGFAVTPGMPVTADVKVGKRTILLYLLGRVLPVVHEGMREP